MVSHDGYCASHHVISTLPQVEGITLGSSVLGEPIELTSSALRNGEHPLLVIGGIHGDEPKGVFVAQRLIEALREADSRAWAVLPVANPDGYARRKRRNANGVDINRNFPTLNWQRTRRNSRMYGGSAPQSEPETRAILLAIERVMPAAIVALHSIDRHRFCNNFDGPAEEHARVLARSNGYPVKPSIGYPTPGSFGSWAGIERSIPVVTLELPSHHSPQRCWRDNQRGLLELVRSTAEAAFSCT